MLLSAYGWVKACKGDFAPGAQAPLSHAAITATLLAMVACALLRPSWCRPPRTRKSKPKNSVHVCMHESQQQDAGQGYR